MKDKEYYKQEGLAYSMRNIVELDSRVKNTLDAIRKHVSKGQKILDLGCGDMYLSEALPEYQFTGLDINTTKNPKIIEHDLTSIPYPIEKGSFDAVICSEVLEHLFDPLAVVKEARRVLRVGGTLIVTVPNFDTFENLLTFSRSVLYNPDNRTSVEHIRYWNPQILGHQINQCGFKVIEHQGNSSGMNELFNTPRAVLTEVLRKYNPSITTVQVDQIIDRMFPSNCVGILMVARAT
jgi:2-polyprenyl-3-methyl-5-hydroxy-6-metoxy-1,4-benzoquinol methylase